MTPEDCTRVSSMNNLPIIALSVRQPWAWAIIHGGKDIENRSEGAVRHGMTTGDICIHAAKGMTQSEYEEARAFMQSIGVACPRPDELVRGAIIGTVHVVAIVPRSNSPWFFGPRGLLLREQKPCEPIYVPGQLGYFKWQESLLKNPEGFAPEQPTPWMVAWGRKREEPQGSLL